MTTTNDTTNAVNRLQDTKQWLGKGRKALEVIKRIEAGLISAADGSVPVIPEQTVEFHSNLPRYYQR